MQDEIAVVQNATWKRNTLIVGAALGLLAGAGAAYLFIQQHDTQNGQSPEFSAGDGVKLGVMVLGLLRGIAAI